MFARLNLCAVEFKLAAAAKPREDLGAVELLAASPPFPTRANKKKPPATQATNAGDFEFDGRLAKKLCCLIPLLIS